MHGAHTTVLRVRRRRCLDDVPREPPRRAPFGHGRRRAGQAQICISALVIPVRDARTRFGGEAVGFTLRLKQQS